MPSDSGHITTSAGHDRPAAPLPPTREPASGQRSPSVGSGRSAGKEYGASSYGRLDPWSPESLGVGCPDGEGCRRSVCGAIGLASLPTARHTKIDADSAPARTGRASKLTDAQPLTSGRSTIPLPYPLQKPVTALVPRRLTASSPTCPTSPA